MARHVDTTRPQDGPPTITRTYGYGERVQNLISKRFDEMVEEFILDEN